MLKEYGVQDQKDREDSFKCGPKREEKTAKKKRGFFDRLVIQLLVSVLIVAGAVGVKNVDVYKRQVT